MNNNTPISLEQLELHIFNQSTSGPVTLSAQDIETLKIIFGTSNQVKLNIYGIDFVCHQHVNAFGGISHYSISRALEDELVDQPAKSEEQPVVEEVQVDPMTEIHGNKIFNAIKQSRAFSQMQASLDVVSSETNQAPVVAPNNQPVATHEENQNNSWDQGLNQHAAIKQELNDLFQSLRARPDNKKPLDQKSGQSSPQFAPTVRDQDQFYHLLDVNSKNPLQAKNTSHINQLMAQGAKPLVLEQKPQVQEVKFDYQKNFASVDQFWHQLLNFYGEQAAGSQERLDFLAAQDSATPVYQQEQKRLAALLDAKNDLSQLLNFHLELVNQEKNLASELSRLRVVLISNQLNPDSSEEYLALQEKYQNVCNELEALEARLNEIKAQQSAGTFQDQSGNLQFTEVLGFENVINKHQDLVDQKMADINESLNAIEHQKAQLEQLLQNKLQTQKLNQAQKTAYQQEKLALSAALHDPEVKAKKEAEHLQWLAEQGRIHEQSAQVQAQVAQENIKLANAIANLEALEQVEDYQAHSQELDANIEALREQKAQLERFLSDAQWKLMHEQKAAIDLCQWAENHLAALEDQFLILSHNYQHETGKALNAIKYSWSSIAIKQLNPIFTNKDGLFDQFSSAIVHQLERLVLQQQKNLKMMHDCTNDAQRIFSAVADEYRQLGYVHPSSVSELAFGEPKVLLAKAQLQQYLSEPTKNWLFATLPLNACVQQEFVEAFGEKNQFIGLDPIAPVEQPANLVAVEQQPSDSRSLAIAANDKYELAQLQQINQDLALQLAAQQEINDNKKLQTERMEKMLGNQEAAVLNLIEDHDQSTSAEYLEFKNTIYAHAQALIATKDVQLVGRDILFSDENQEAAEVEASQLYHKATEKLLFSPTPQKFVDQEAQIDHINKLRQAPQTRFSTNFAAQNQQDFTPATASFFATDLQEQQLPVAQNPHEALLNELTADVQAELDQEEQLQLPAVVYDPKAESIPYLANFQALDNDSGFNTSATPTTTQTSSALGEDSANVVSYDQMMAEVDAVGAQAHVSEANPLEAQEEELQQDLTEVDLLANDPNVPKSESWQQAEQENFNFDESLTFDQESEHFDVNLPEAYVDEAAPAPKNKKRWFNFWKRNDQAEQVLVDPFGTLDEPVSETNELVEQQTSISELNDEPQWDQAQLADPTEQASESELTPESETVAAEQLTPNDESTLVDAAAANLADATTDETAAALDNVLVDELVVTNQDEPTEFASESSANEVAATNNPENQAAEAVLTLSSLDGDSHVNVTTEAHEEDGVLTLVEPDDLFAGTDLAGTSSTVLQAEFVPKDPINFTPLFKQARNDVERTDQQILQILEQAVPLDDE